jgi:RNA polymerase sigma-70 factor (ECF subfamily)
MLSRNPETLQAEKEQAIALDRERVLLALDGDQDAFTDLVLDYQRSVYNLTFRMLGDSVEAEDAAQEAFLRAYRNLERYDMTRSFKTWVLSIASNFCIDIIRKRRLSLLSLDDLLPGEVMSAIEHQSIEELMVDGERDRSVQEMMALLKADERAIIILRYWNDLSYEEIADALGINVGVVKSRLFRARQALANRIKVREPGLVFAHSAAV